MAFAGNDGARPLPADGALVHGAAAAEQAERGQTLAALSNAVVAIHKRFYGKGPTKARSHLSHDLVVVVLDGGFMRSEHTLSDRGYEREVVQLRLAMQSSVEAEFRAAVERITDRSVRSFMSANDLSTDLQAEIFVLHPRDGESSRPSSTPAATEAAR
jgi:uncharacterized protein YbcI